MCCELAFKIRGRLDSLCLNIRLDHCETICNGRALHTDDVTRYATSTFKSVYGITRMPTEPRRVKYHVDLKRLRR